MGDAGGDEGRKGGDDPDSKPGLAVETAPIPVGQVEELVCRQALRLLGDESQERRRFVEVALEPLGGGP